VPPDTTKSQRPNSLRQPFAKIAATAHCIGRLGERRRMRGAVCPPIEYNAGMGQFSLKRLFLAVTLIASGATEGDPGNHRNCPPGGIALRSPRWPPISTDRHATGDPGDCPNKPTRAAGGCAAGPPPMRQGCTHGEIPIARRKFIYLRPADFCAQKLRGRTRHGTLAQPAALKSRLV
jgi:hypothetical protein